MSLISISEFCEKHGISSSTVYQTKSKRDRNIDSEYLIENNDGIFINEKFMNERADQIKRIWCITHDYYYYFTYVIGDNQNQLAKVLGNRTKSTYESWATYLSKLFYTNTKSIMSIRISTQTIEFIEFCEKYIPMIHKKLKNDKIYIQRLNDMV